MLLSHPEGYSLLNSYYVGVVDGLYKLGGSTPGVTSTGHHVIPNRDANSELTFYNITNTAIN